MSYFLLFIKFVIANELNLLLKGTNNEDENVEFSYSNFIRIIGIISWSNA